MIIMKQVKISWNKGKTGIYSKETLKKMSEGRKGKNKGENNFMYGKEKQEKLLKNTQGLL